MSTMGNADCGVRNEKTSAADWGLVAASQRDPSIEVHIEELVLHGFSPADRLRIGAALEGELARLFAERGLPESLAGGAEVEAIDAGAFARGPLATPASIGGQVAQAVYAGFAR